LGRLRCVFSVILRIIIICALIFSAGFIIYNSLKNGRESSLQSRAFYSRFKAIIKAAFGVELAFSDKLVRKAAHFTEFFIFGAAAFLSAAIFKRAAWYILPTALLLPFADEYVQSRIEGRNASFSDCMIDFAGLLCGFLLFVAAYAFIRFIFDRGGRKP